MTKLRTIHRCTDCGGASPQWVGRCPTCGEWNTLVEEVEELQPARAAGLSLGLADRPVPIAEVDPVGWASRPTGIGELDRVLGGGFVPGSVTLVGGEPGIGKSTLLLQALAATAESGAKALLVSAEESKEQVRLRADRLGTLSPSLWLLSETNLAGILLAVAEVEPDLLVIDSIQTVYDPALGSTPGSVTQVRGCAQQLVTAAKDRGM